MNDLTFTALRAANASRKTRWHGEADEWSGADWSNAMCGEAGEAANVVKKIRRHETHTGTAYNTPDLEQLLPALAEELADVVTYADLLAHKYGIDLGAAVAAKFNRVSAAQDFPERLPVADPVVTTPHDDPIVQACVDNGGHFWPANASEEEPPTCTRCWFNPGWHAGKPRNEAELRPVVDAPQA